MDNDLDKVIDLFRDKFIPIKRRMNNMDWRKKHNLRDGECCSTCKFYSPLTGECINIDIKNEANADSDNTDVMLRWKCDLYIEEEEKNG